MIKKGISDAAIFKKYSKIVIPIRVLNSRPLTTYEATVKYLIEVKKLNYHIIGVLLGRNERDIWRIYYRVKQK